MPETKLKLGILLDSYDVPAWVQKSLERIIHANCAEFSLIILNDKKKINASKVKKLWDNKRKILYSVFSKLDEKLFHMEPNAFEIKNIREMLHGVPVINVRPIEREYSDYFERADIDTIKEHKLDVLIRMGFRILRGEVLTAAKYGIWSYHHGDNKVNRGGPPGFWESVENWHETGSVLQILGENLDGGTVLCRSWSSTYTLSPYRNRNFYYWTAASFLPRQIELLHYWGEKKYFKEIEKLNCTIDFYDNKLYKIPSNVRVLWAIAEQIFKIAHKIYKDIFYLDKWYLMFDLKPEISTTFRKFRKIIPPKDRFWADPHVIKLGDKLYIFIEEYMYENKKGHISVIEMDQHGNYTKPVTVIEKDYHLSYPFVFEWNGKYYMIPESKENKTIELYECEEFPFKWKHIINLMENVQATDTTLFYKDGMWWLFAGIAENMGATTNDELFLYFSNELITNKWKPHPLNPIVSDVKNARPAGKLFKKDGKLFRPSQDSSVRYGYGFNLNQIMVLSETEYLEKKIISVQPNWEKGIQGTHTFTYECPLTIIDVFEKKLKFI